MWDLQCETVEEEMLSPSDMLCLEADGGIVVHSRAVERQIPDQMSRNYNMEPVDRRFYSLMYGTSAKFYLWPFDAGNSRYTGNLNRWRFAKCPVCGKTYLKYYIYGNRWICSHCLHRESACPEEIGPIQDTSGLSMFSPWQSRDGHGWNPRTEPW